jgi:hypothetical protein
MRAFAKVVLIACGVIAAIIFIGIAAGKSPSHDGNPLKSASNDATNAANSSATYSDGYNPESAEVLLPYELSKNPYKWKGRSGILDTQRATYVMPNGTAAPMGIGLGSIKFDKMLDEHTALYDVMTVDNTLMPDGQIAVLLPDSDPPNLRKLWKVLVVGSLDGTNAFGSGVTVTEIKFEEYYTPPPKPAAAEPAPASISSQEQSATAQSSEPTGTWTPLSHSADAITGDVSLSGTVIAIADTSYPITTDHVLSINETGSVAGAFSIQPNQSLDARLYHTNIPAKATMSNGNRICGSGTAEWFVALTTSVQGADPNSSRQLNLMFLSGDSQPTLDADTLAHSGRLCGTYSYQRATRTSAPG